MGLIMKHLVIGDVTYDVPAGTVTSIALSNANNGGLSVSGSPITDNGTITIGHSNVLTNAQTTQAVYPIAIDKNGHISGYGTAVTIVNTRGTAASGGTTLSVVNTGDMFIWNNKQDKLTNPVTGTGRANYLVQWNGDSAVIEGPKFTTNGTRFLKEDGTWATVVTVDEKVKQTPTSTGNAIYELLFSESASDNELIEGTRKTSALRYNPTSKVLVNNGEVRANKGVFNELVATTLKAESATIDDLTAQNATIVGLLDVQGEMHTNQWTNANIANVGGSFYISPTVSSNNTMTITIGTETIGGTTYYTMMVGAPNNSFVTDAVKIYDSTHDPATYNPGWPIGSRVMVTGNIRVGDNGIDYPLGTLTGYLTQALSGTGFTLGRIAQDSQLSTIFAELGITNPTLTTFKSTNISISMYEIGSGTIDGTLKPVGIMMTSYGVDKSTYLDIYGGVNQKSSDSVTGQTDPNLRIGYLGGLPSFNVNNKTTVTPTGWGIYTDNGFFKGVIAATSGIIGGFDIGQTDLHNGTFGDTTNSVWMSTGKTSNLSIGGSPATNHTWGFTAGKKFGVTVDGTMYADGASLHSVDAYNFIVRDNNNAEIASFTSNGITFSPSTSFTLGNQYAQIAFDPGIGSGDSSISITGDNIYFAQPVIDNIVTEVVDEIEIGGRNLLLSSESYEDWKIGSDTIIDGDIAILTGSSSDWNSMLNSRRYDIALYDGETNYVWSFEYKVENNCDIICLIAASSAILERKDWTRSKYCTWRSTTIPGTNGLWVKYTLPARTIAVSELTSGSGDTYSGFLQLFCRTNNANLQVRHWKLEKGTISTDWTPAPEDAEQDLILETEGELFYQYSPTVSYQWYEKNSPTGNWSSSQLSGNNTNTLSFVPTLSHNGKQLRCTVNASNGDSIVSNTANLIVVDKNNRVFNFDNGENIRLKDFIATIEPIQSGSGSPSSSNIRSISGHTNVTVTVADDYSTPTINRTYTTTFGNQLINTSINESGAIDANGNEIENESFNRTPLILVSKETIFFKSDIPSGYIVRIHGYNNGTWIQQLKTINTNVGYEDEITIPSTINQIRISYPTIGINNTYLYEMIVYGGILDIMTGVLTVTDEYIANYNGETLPSTWISDRDVYASGTNPTIGAQVVYKLETPKIYYLSVPKITLNNGFNSIWTNTGDIDITCETKFDFETGDIANDTRLSIIEQPISQYIELWNINSGDNVTFRTIVNPTYDVSYDNDNEQYYYYKVNGTRTTLTYADLLKEDGIPVTKRKGGLTDRASAAETNISDLSGAIDNQATNISNLQTQADGNSRNIISQATDIVGLQTRQDNLNQSITTTNTTVYNLGTRVSDLERGVVIKPSEPSVTVVSERGAVKVTDGKITIQGKSNTVSWADEESFNSKRLVASDIRPRYMSFKQNEITGETEVNVMAGPSGSYTIIGRSNGHMSVVKTLT